MKKHIKNFRAFLKTIKFTGNIVLDEKELFVDNIIIPIEAFMRFLGTYNGRLLLKELQEGTLQPLVPDKEYTQPRSSIGETIERINAPRVVNTRDELLRIVEEIFDA